MVTFHVPDMTCSHCAGTIRKAIAAVDPASRVEVDVARKLVRVTGAAPAAACAEALHRAGYSTQDVTAPAAGKPGGCGCGCGPRAAEAVDVPQAGAAAAGPCCS